MRVMIVTVGVVGDVAPLTGVGARLAAAGVDVTMATNCTFADLVRSCGLAFHPVSGDFHTMLASPTVRRWVRGGRVARTATAYPANLTAVMRQVAGVMREAAEGIVTALDSGVDAVLVSNTAAPLCDHVAEAMGIPSLGTYWGPLEPTREFPPIMVGGRPFGRMGNLLAGQVAVRLTELVYRSGIARQREMLGLGALRAGAHRRAQRDRRWPILHGVSPAVLPRPRDWRPGLEMVGYFWPYRAPGWQPPPRLVDFLAAGPPPVFIGFGSMTPGDSGRVGELLVAALRRCGLRGVIQSGAAELHVDTDDVMTIGAVPHEWLFPHMAAIVHHAGAGITAQAVRAGVPSVPVPVLGDDSFWAARLVRLGVSPGLVEWPQLQADRLAEQLHQVVSDPSYRARCRALAAQVAAEDGAGRVVSAVARLVEPPSGVRRSP